MTPLPPGSTIGIVGGGQLGRMLSMAAARLGFRVVVLAREADSPAGQVSAEEIVGRYDDPAAVAELARRSDIVTFEFENIPAAVLAGLDADGVKIAPPSRALAISQDRLEEKTFLNSRSIPTVDFAAINGAEDIGPALERLGAPALLKTRREGYDGKGQAWIRDASEGEAAFAALGGKPAILEADADFVRELSVIAARGRGGEMFFYPLGENRHEKGVLRTTVAPAADQRLWGEAASIAHWILEALGYVGVIGVELFDLGPKADPHARLLVNEFAPRVHNTGHWTLDGCAMDQFELHIRAIAGWSLGVVNVLSRVEMTNLLGEEVNEWPKLAADPTARVWLYGKRDVAPGRKMGHVNRLLGPVSAD